MTIESGAEFGRRKYRSGQVVRLDLSYVVVKASGPRDGTFIERYGRRDGVRVGGVNRAELVSADPSQTNLPVARCRTQHIDSLFREWSRNRTDTDRLRRLHAAISECLEEADR
ncbi:hypothetical protein ACI78Z_24780 [Geodermatophilus sp. SYSU D01176]